MADPDVLIRQLQGEVDKLKAGVARGVVTVTFTASTNAPAVTVAHGLAGAPAGIAFGPGRAVGEVRFAAVYENVTATTFDVSAWCDVVFTGSLDVSWIAFL